MAISEKKTVGVINYNKSLIKITNSKGPKTDPQDTPNSRQRA
jgi:hypothetical protein